MRYDFFFTHHFYYFRIADFLGDLKIDPEGNVIYPPDFDITKYDHVKNRYEIPDKNILVFDPSLLVLLLPQITESNIKKFNNLNLIYTSFGLFIPFIIELEKQGPSKKIITIKYQGNDADKMKFSIEKLLIESGTSYAKDIIGKQKALGELKYKLQ